MPARQRDADAFDHLGELLLQMTASELEHFLASLDARNLTIVERALADVARSGWRSSPAAMAAQLGGLKRMPHTDYLSDRFVAAVRGTSPRQIWNMPARHGKSLIGSQWGPTWALDTVPSIKLALTSYGDQLANENSAIVRDLLVSHGDVLGVRLKRDRRRIDRFVTDEGGGLIAAGVGSGLTGFGAHGIVVDDPFKNWQEAHSEARRLAIWNWYRAVVRLRLEQRDDGTPGFIIIVMTRWHEDDLTGRLLEAAEEEGEEWEHVFLPAIAEDDDLLGRAPGEALAPALYDIDALVARAGVLGSYLTAGMEQQHPAPEEGTDIMRGWWKWYDAPPPRYDDALTSWDMKLKDKETGDYVVGQAWGRTGSDFWGIDQLRGQYNFATTKAAIALMHVRHPWIKRHVIENTGNGPEVIDQLRRPMKDYIVSPEIQGALGMTDDEARRVERVMRRGMTGIVPENPKGDKRARMRAQTPYIEAGNVHLPENKPWADALVTESALFPNGSHDDQVDACSQALKRLSKMPGGVGRKPTKRVGKPKPSARAKVVRPPTARAQTPKAPGRAFRVGRTRGG